MSKVVTIPKDRNPFVVIVNGVKHSYPAGVSTEVPDEVADVIEKYVGAKPKPDPNAGGGVSWNDLKDKPFGDSPTGGDTLKWDGNTEGLVQAGGFVCKVSDAIPTMADLANGCTITLSTGETFEITADNMGDMVVDFTVSGVPCIAIAEFATITLEDNADLSEAYGFEFVAPKKGVYFLHEDGIFTSSLTISGYTGFPVTKKIEAKYLPGIKYVYINEDVEGNRTASATYAQIATWIKSGLDVKCVCTGIIASLMFSSALSGITTYMSLNHHAFVVMYDINQGMRIQINDNDDINVYWIENIE